MSAKRVQIAVGFGLALIIGLALIQGCGEITGDFNFNRPPEVEIVNVPQDAYGVDTTYHYGMPFKVAEYNSPVVILNMQGTSWVSNSEKVYALDPSDPTDTTLFVSGTDYDIDTVFVVDTVAALIAKADGNMVLDSTYYIDFSFTINNYYVFSFAPTIHWVGYDPDGFVEYYRYADIVDPAFIADFRAESDQETWFNDQDRMGNVTWTDTCAMQARIYLLTTEGDTTEHLFFVKAVDDLGAESNNLAGKTFYRTNNPPNNPQIKPLDRPDGEFTLNYVVEDTLFCLDELTPLWEGISFNWTGDDPDDMELYRIPLEYTYYLIKTPGDTIWAWSNSSWSESAQIQIYDLETGSYTFSVWVQDDGLSLCSEPATITFKVVRPTFEYHILVVDETKNAGVYEIMPGDSVSNFYYNLLANLEGQLDNDNYVMDGVDVRFLDNSDDIAKAGCPIPYSLIGQYRLILIYDDDHANAAPDYRTNRNTVLADYLDVGGNLWVQGRRIMAGSYGISNGEAVISGFLGDYMQLETGYATDRLAGDPIEFLGAVPVVGGFPALEVNPSHVNMINDPLATDSIALMEVDWFTRSDDAVTLYTFDSNTADTSITSPFIYDEDAQVETGSTPTSCWVTPGNPGLLEVYRVENITKGVVAEVDNFNSEQILVSYPYGEPWNNGDTLEVDYKFDPISDMHLKPVAVRYEAQPRILVTAEFQGVTYSYYTNTLGYRTAIFAFPLFFMKNENGETEAVAREMLNWFFYPTMHWQL